MEDHACDHFHATEELSSRLENHSAFAVVQGLVERLIEDYAWKLRLPLARKRSRAKTAGADQHSVTDITHRIPTNTNTRLCTVERKIAVSAV
jgi:hypothetical protein